MCGSRPDNINSEHGNLFPLGQKFQDRPRQYGEHASAWGSSRAAVSPAADIHGERPDQLGDRPGMPSVELIRTSRHCERQSDEDSSTTLSSSANARAGSI